jgi:hypothetical protein
LLHVARLNGVLAAPQKKFLPAFVLELICLLLGVRLL